jgi:hypothetical protein
VDSEVQIPMVALQALHKMDLCEVVSWTDPRNLRSFHLELSLTEEQALPSEQLAEPETLADPN